MPTLTPMEQIGIALRAFLVADTRINAIVEGRIHEDKVPILDQDFDTDPVNVKPYIWFGQSGTITDVCLDERRAIADELLYDVEAIANNQTVAKNLGSLIRIRLEGHSGVMGDMRVQLVEVSDHDSDYLPRGRSLDIGLFESTFQISVTP